MSTEIERTEDVPNQPQPDPIQTLNGIAAMQAMTLGFLIGSQIIMTRHMRRMSITKEVVVVYKEVTGEVTA